ncbi:MAG TPA: tetratricopeptide repeat protein [Pyrinomonadaceae bacterium]|jgi:tetratricopeptide (TPR) repeat protein
MADTPQSNVSNDFIRTYKFFGGFMALGVILVAWGGWPGHPFAALLWSLACLGCGAFTGFLFGIPRVLQGDNANPPVALPPASAPATGAPTTTTTTSPRPSSYSVRVNTNLEQISDWLTKIIVGLTLIELQKIPDNVNRLAAYIAHSLGGPADTSFAAALLIYFFIGGFLSSYLFTRLFLTGALVRADIGAISDLPIDPAAKEALASARLNTEQGPQQPSGGPSQLTGDAAQAAKQIVNASTTLDQLTSVSDIVVWAKAQFDAKNYAEAVRGYRKALELAPNDVNVRVEYALALWEEGKTPLNIVKEQLLDAYKRLTPQTDDRDRERVYIYLTTCLLYLDPPAGFTDAIRYCQEYIDGKYPNRGGIYVNLAAAYGQQYRWYKNQSASEATLNEARGKALAASRAALTIDPEWQTRLRMLLDPDYPGKDRTDNDLEDLANDVEFRTLLGLSPPTPVPLP